jgi:Kelch motif
MWLPDSLLIDRRSARGTSTRTPACLHDIVDSISGTKYFSRSLIGIVPSMGCGLTPHATPTATRPSAVSLTMPLIISLGVSNMARAKATVVRTAAIPAAMRARSCQPSTASRSFDACCIAACTNASTDRCVVCASVLLRAMTGSAAAVLAITAPAPAAQWFPAASMREPRAGQTATLLPDGEVLVAGGYHIDIEHGWRYKSSRSTELFNPTTNTWRLVAPMLAERSLATATLLTNGDVLIAGGERYIPGYSGGFSPEVPAETYDPNTDIWTPFPSPEFREVNGLALLPNGRLFALGWSFAKESLAGALYDPATDTWEQTAAAAHPRRGATLALLKDGNVLVS